MLEIRLRFSLFFFLTFISLFSLILYLIRFNTNNERYFLNNGDRKEFEIKKQKFTQSGKFQRAVGKLSIFKIEAQAFGTGDFLNIFLRFFGF